MSIVKGHRIETNQVSFSDVKTNDNGGKTIYMNYNKGMFKVQTPVMTLPYDMSCYDKGDYPKYSLDVAFRDLDSDYRVKGFHDNMSQLEQFILGQALENSKKWFAKTHKSLDVLSALFTPLVKKSIDRETGEPDGRYADTMKFKLPVRDGRPGFDITDFEDKPLKDAELASMLTKESKVQAILRCGGIWIIAGKFGCTWRAEQMKVKPVTNFDEYAFDDSDEEEVEKIDEN